MYIPKDFEVTDKEKMLALIETNAFGALISRVNDRQFCTHVPFLIASDNQSLLCHIAERNPQWQEIEDQEVLVIFQGAHDYVSPSWYESPGVPTWNYQVIHIYGRPKLITDTEKLKTLVDNLTEKYESTLKKPWQPEYDDKLLSLIVGIEIQITEFQGKYKLSQNRSETDRSHIIEALQELGSEQMTAAIQKELL